MKHQFFIATYPGDFKFLLPCLVSLRRFAEGFLPPTLAVEQSHLRATLDLVKEAGSDARVVVFDPLQYLKVRHLPGSGMQRAQAAMIMADVLCPDADVVHLLGSDCLATERVTPDHFMRDGKVVVLTQTYESLRKHHPDACGWQDGTAAVLGHVPELEYMRRLPSSYHRLTLGRLRWQIEKLHGMSFLDYWFDAFGLGQRGFSEANLLGHVADIYDQTANIRPLLYYFVDVERHGYQQTPIMQFWSHGGLDHPIDRHFKLPDQSDTYGVTPRGVIQKILGHVPQLP